jgi:hypothetical protein
MWLHSFLFSFTEIDKKFDTETQTQESKPYYLQTFDIRQKLHQVTSNNVNWLKLPRRINTDERLSDGMVYPATRFVSLCHSLENQLCLLCRINLFKSLYIAVLNDWSSVKASTRNRKETRKPCVLMTLRYEISSTRVAHKRGQCQGTL